MPLVLMTPMSDKKIGERFNDRANAEISRQNERDI